MTEEENYKQYTLTNSKLAYDAIDSQRTTFGAHRPLAFRLAYVDQLLMFWEFSWAAVLSFQEYASRSDFLVSDNAPGWNDTNTRRHSASLAAYGHMRVCLNACRVLAENALQTTKNQEAADKLQKYRKAHASLASRIIKIRNEVGNHPDEPKAILTGGGLWSEHSTHFRTFDLYDLEFNDAPIIEPLKDALKLKQYLEGLLEHLVQCWESSM